MSTDVGNLFIRKNPVSEGCPPLSQPEREVWHRPDYNKWLHSIFYFLGLTLYALRLVHLLLLLLDQRTQSTSLSGTRDEKRANRRFDSMNEISTRPSAVVHVTRDTFFLSSLRLHLLEQSDEIESRLSKSQSSPPTVGSTLCVWKRFQSFHVSFKFLSFICAVISLKNETPLRYYASLYGSYGVMTQSFRDSLRKGKQKTTDK